MGPTLTGASGSDSGFFPSTDTDRSGMRRAPATSLRSLELRDDFFRRASLPPPFRFRRIVSGVTNLFRHGQHPKGTFLVASPWNIGIYLSLCVLTQSHLCLPPCGWVVTLAEMITVVGVPGPSPAKLRGDELAIWRRTHRRRKKCTFVARIVKTPLRS